LLKPRVPETERRPGGRLASALRRLAEGASPGRVVAVALVVALCAAAAVTRLRVDDSWVRNLPAESDIVRGDRFFNEKLSGTTTLELMTDAGSAGWFDSTEGLHALGSLEYVLARVANVGSVQCLFDDVVRVNATLAGVNYGAYREALRTGRFPLAEGDVRQALAVLSLSRRLPARERVDEEYRRARVTVFVRDADYERIGEVLRAARRETERQGRNHRVVPFGDGWVSYLTVALLVEGQAYSIGLALLVDLLVLSLLLRSVRLGLVTIAPVVFSMLVVFAALAATGTSLGIANSMFAGIALGIGLDFSVHLVTTYRQKLRAGVLAGEALRRTLDLSGPAVCVSAASITAGFSVLLLSEIAPNLQLGLMLCLCLLACAASTLLLVPALLKLRGGRP
ncbi:MAG TPA: MMPL family transporter, partial [Pyrinomonadaceae bacterium]|nr:MMPL family transporter [Pyrinomonadaceae bacterium]